MVVRPFSSRYWTPSCPWAPPYPTYVSPTPVLGRHAKPTSPASVSCTCAIPPSGGQVATSAAPTARVAWLSTVYGSETSVARGLSQMLDTIAGTHAVPVQKFAVPHALPQAPQFLGSSDVSTQTPLQHVRPFEQRFASVSQGGPASASTLPSEPSAPESTAPSPASD